MDLDLIEKNEEDMITIKEVARKAGVSIGTVSNVINGAETVTDKNRQKVLDVIENTGYRPNKIAASLINKKTLNIGLIVPDISSPYYSDLIKGVAEALELKGYNVFLSGSNNKLEKEEHIIKDLLSLWVDGIILIPVYDKYRDTGFLNGLDVPIVMVNREIKGLKKDLVIFDNFNGGLKAARFLIDSGHKNIMILAGPEYSRSFMDRFMGWKEALEEKNLYRDDLVFFGDCSVGSGHRLMKEALLKNKNNIDAVFASSDLIAIGAINAIVEEKIDIPGSISIIGFGDIYLSKYINPALTTIKRPFYDIGKTAVKVLLKRISGNTGMLPEKVVINGELEIRESAKLKGGV